MRKGKRAFCPGSFPVARCTKVALAANVYAMTCTHNGIYLIFSLFRFVRRNITLAPIRPSFCYWLVFRTDVCTLHRPHTTRINVIHCSNRNVVQICQHVVFVAASSQKKKRKRKTNAFRWENRCLLCVHLVEMSRLNRHIPYGIRCYALTQQLAGLCNFRKNTCILILTALAFPQTCSNVFPHHICHVIIGLFSFEKPQ